MALLYLLLLWAVFCDVRTFRIPNRLILAGYLSGALYRCCFPGESARWEYFLGAVGIFFLLVPLYQLRTIGGGDVKLLSVCGMFLGFSEAFSVVIYSILAGGILSALYLVYHRIFSFQKLNKQDRHVIHFSIAILLGVTGNLFWGGALCRFL